MPAKIDSHKSYGEKLISLFARLLFSGESFSLTELAGLLKCSKPTVMRLIEDIKKSYGVDIEESMRGNRKYYRLVKISKAPHLLPLTESELTSLHMCRIFTEHLLGNQLYNEAARGLDKSLSFAAKPLNTPSKHFASFHSGQIDYTPHQDKIRLLIEAMNASRVCRISYQAILQKKAKTYYIKPLKIFSYRDTLYLHARLAKKPGRLYREPDFDPLLVIHRLKRVEITETGFIYPEDYRFEKIFNRDFGIMKDDSFTAEIEFYGWASGFVSERIWSDDQNIRKLDNGGINISFSASSYTELIAWALSFGNEAKIIGPEWLRKKIADEIESMTKIYE